MLGRIRTVFCLNGPDELNGPNVWLTRHLPLLREQGISAEVLYLSGQPDKPCRFRMMLEASGVPCRNVRLSTFLEENIEAIVDALSDGLPDVFVPNYSVPAYFASRFLREAGVVTIGTLHSDDPYYYDIVDLFVKGDSRWRLSGVVGVSDFLDEVIGTPNRNTIPFLHAPYGAPVPDIVAQPPNDRFVLAYCGRIVEYQKRILRVTSAMMESARSDSRVVGVMWGEGADTERVSALLAQDDIGKRISMKGQVSPLLMQNEMATAHALVLLSDFEGLSIALMEAMAVGLVPIVARMRSGVSDLVIDGENGIVVDGDHVSDFVEKVASLARNPEKWQKLSRAARNTIISRGYTARECARKWGDFVVQLVDAAGPRGNVLMPSPCEWMLPPRTQRPNGIRAVDQRSMLFYAQAAVTEGRPIFLWGASIAGEAVFMSLARVGISVAGFVDSNHAKHGQEHCGLKVFEPEYLTELRKNAVRPFVLISSQFRIEIIDSLNGLGLHEGEDYPED